MKKEFCDKCGEEIIAGASKNRKELELSLRGGMFGDSFRAKVVLCNSCYEKMQIKESVERLGAGEFKEKKPDKVEKFMEIFRELIRECQEE